MKNDQIASIEVALDGVASAADHIADALSSTREMQGVPASLTDVVEAGLRQVAGAITDVGASPGRDSEGNPVGCLTEAVMSASAALGRIASALSDLADAVRGRDA